MTPARMKALFIALVVLPVGALVAQASSGCKTLTVEDQVSIARDGVRIDMCVATAHDCKLAAIRDGRPPAATCWPVYDECMVGAGVKDGGSQ